MGYDLKDVKRILKDKYGIDLNQYSHAFLMSISKKQSSDCGCLFLDEFFEKIITIKEEALNFYDALSIDYTDFFRNPLVYAYLEKVILPNLLHRKSEGSIIKIWSAGCSTGQEAYSVAILCQELLKDYGKNLNYQIFATDWDHNTLSKAKNGIFDTLAISNVKMKYLRKYFNVIEGGYQICDDIKKHVEFTQNDLMDVNLFYPTNSITNQFDLILCNNVLYYYELEKQIDVAKRFEKSLSNEGYLILGEVEFKNVMDKLSIKGIPGIPGVFCR